MRGSFFSSAFLRDEPRDALHVAGLAHFADYRPFFTQVFTPRELFAGPFA
jgi:hypothetical protein